MKSHAQERSLVLGLLILMSFLLLGCPPKPPKVPPLPPEQKVEEFTSNVTANIYFDATESMQGFVRPNSNTRYCQAIDAMARSITSSWKDAKRIFFKFGDEIAALEDYIQAKELSFYNDAKTKRFTRIQGAISRVEPASMTLIVTDLFQDRGDISRLTEEFKQKCFKQDLTFGILGLRSEYDGTIYDLGPNIPALPYRTKPEENTYRPFYIILMGKYSDVVHFYELFKTSGLDFSVNEFIAYSPYLTSRPISFYDARIDSTFYLAEVPNLIPYDRQDARAKQFRIQGDPEIATLVTTLPYSPAPYTMPFDHRQLDIKISATQCLPDTFLSSPQAAKALSFPNWQISSKKDSIAIRAEIRPALLPGDGLYFYEVIFRPKLEAYQYPAWISAWDMEKASTLSNGFNAERKLAGASTLNLYWLLVDLWRANFFIHEQPRIATLYCYFKKG